MKVLVAIDSFKGSLSSLEAGNAIKSGIEELVSQVEVVPIADGGEGSVEAMMNALNAKVRSVQTLDPLGRQICVNYAYTDELAIMEMASSCGLTLLKENERNPEKTSTYGLGIMIQDALNLGIRKFIVGIGGSATNDAGIGMLEALGFEFLDSSGINLSANGANLALVKNIKPPKSNVLKECEFLVACDVSNPLFGTNGAAHIYGPQKGADIDMVKRLDSGLVSFAKVSKEFLGVDNSFMAGSGAAGGLGFGFVSFLGAKLKPGFEIISSVVRLEEKLQNADLVITGEGKMDYQSIMGKTPTAVAKLAKARGLAVIAFTGAVGSGARATNEFIDAYFCIQQGAISLEDAMNSQTASKNLQEVAYQAMRLFLLR